MDYQAYLKQTDHRPYPPPANRAWVARQTWGDLLFVHWKLPAPTIRKCLPPQLPLDTYNGDTWVSLVAFTVSDFQPRGAPFLQVPLFTEINLRTYVVMDGEPGIYTFFLDADNPLAVWGARLLYRLPYFNIRAQFRRKTDHFALTTSRASSIHSGTLHVEWSPFGEAFSPSWHTLDGWLTHRYCIYAVDSYQRVFRTEIHHGDWTLQNARVDVADYHVIESNGIPFDASQVCAHYAKNQRVLLWLPQQIAMTRENRPA